MKRGIIATLITAFSIMLGGVMLMAFALHFLGASPQSFFEYSKGDIKTDTVSEPVTALRIETGAGNVEIVPSEDGICTVTRHETEKVYYSVSVEAGTLVVRRVDNRAWYEWFTLRFGGAPTVTVSLPEKEYEALQVKASSGSVLVESGLTFNKATVKVTSGSVRYFGDATAELTIQSTSGSLYAKGISATEVQGSLTSGRMELEDISCQRLTLSGSSGSAVIRNAAVTDAFSLKRTSGSVTLCDVVSQGEFSVKNTSGSVKLERCDGARISIETSSGSVRGSVRTEKVFNAKTTSGSVNVPQSVPNAGLCEIKTTSGSIRISISTED